MKKRQPPVQSVFPTVCKMPPLIPDPGDASVQTDFILYLANDICVSLIV